MTVRATPPGLAPLLELLELEQPAVVTTRDLARLSSDAGVGWPLNVIAQRLRERGWLLPLKTRGVWEFAPAARAGAFGSGDPLIELRAVLARDPDAPYAVAAESAAFLLGLSSRRPDRETIGAPPGRRVPDALADFRVARWSPVTPLARRDGLPTWSLETLLAYVATRPSGYHDWPNVGEWLKLAASAVRVAELARELDGRSAGSWARAAYLLELGGAGAVARALYAQAPAGSGPHYLGDRSRPGRHDRTYDVIDSTGIEVRAE